ncbi:MAG TPA: hypothetical protein VF789_12070 [Thermoanaerobaculia bacterium]
MAQSEPDTANHDLFSLAGTLMKGSRHFRREAPLAKKVTTLLSKGGGLHTVCTQGDLPLRGLGMYQALLERSWSVRHDNVKEMIHLAQAAVVVARRLDKRHYRPRLIADFQARAWCELGNAHRAADNLGEAEHAFATAFDFFLQGTDNRHLKARLNQAYASFLGTRRQFEPAFAALDVVCSIYIGFGNHHLIGRTLLAKAIYMHYSGQPGKALVLNSVGRALIDVCQDPALDLQAALNKMWFLVACGRFREAKKELIRNREALEKIEARVVFVKLRWLQGQVFAGLGDWDQAESALLEAKEGFESLELGLAAALASMDLALLWMRQHRLTECEHLVEETYQVFVSLNIHREAIGAFQVLNKAREKRMMTIPLLASVVEYLHRAQHNPDIPFVPKWT